MWYCVLGSYEFWCVFVGVRYLVESSSLLGRMIVGVWCCEYGSSGLVCLVVGLRYLVQGSSLLGCVVVGVWYFGSGMLYCVLWKLVCCIVVGVKCIVLCGC